MTSRRPVSRVDNGRGLSTGQVAISGGGSVVPDGGQVSIAPRGGDLDKGGRN